MTAAALAAQVRAAAPARSSWVAANAGSGKTRVLTDRVARLLLAGTEPQRILCLTYTKAAAAEMQNRLYATLGAWAMLDDAALRAALAALGEPGEAIPPPSLARARTLFARALETPGGLRIQTIHAFCEALLRRFPLEAGVAPRFAVLEDRQAKALREAVLDAVAEQHPEVAAATVRHLAGDDPDPLLAEIGHHRAAFEAPFDPGRLAACLGVDPGLRAADLLAATVRPEDRGLLAALVPVLAASSPSDRKAATTLADALAEPEPDAQLEQLEGLLLYGKGAQAPFAAKLGAFPTRPVRAAHPGLAAGLDALMQRLADARPRRLGVAAFARSAALNTFARIWLAAHDARKRALGLLDFDDMIDRACRLLADPATAAWVLWRLDGGIDHVLVDEAQDTSPTQWQIIKGVSAEFFAGAGARDVVRTIFVVGDAKQSIYSFQGADPSAFGAMRAYFEQLLGAMGSQLQKCDLIHSFRSAPPILRLVDAVFGGPAGAALDPGVTHDAIAPDRPGRVELWPFLPRPDRPEEGPWYQPVDTRGPDDPVELLATRIATRIRGWLDARRQLPGSDGARAIRAGDVMILVQRRSALFDAIIRALKRAGVPVAGADVLRIGAELAVKDLLAALRVAATPADDLSLAALLRSPLGGLAEDELFALAHGRHGTLRAALRGLPPERFAAPRAILDDLSAQADYLRPFELLQRVLIRHDGRRKLVARLGAEAEDGIDALLDQALAYERVEPPSLGGFLDWIDRDEMQVKRRTEEGADQVRVMTVHGAKGLEAPIVILPDTGPRQDGPRPPEVLRLDDGQAVWRMRADATPPAIEAAEAARRARWRAENMRLLYVALTRARSWLIVCGAGADPNGDSWHGLVAEALAGLGPVAEPGPDGDTLVLAQNWTDSAAAERGAPPAAAAPPPPWQPGAGARRGPLFAPLAPSALGGAHVLPEAGLAESDAVALARGAAIHLLLETLRDRPEADWPALARRLLPDTAEAADLLAEAAGVLRAADLEIVFAPGTLAEVDVSAALPELDGARILGRIDRLVVAADRVLAVDFKSNRTVPAGPDAVPEGILRQMGAYHAALAAIFPGRRVETAIVWTRTARLMPLPDALVVAALARARHLDPLGARP